MAMICSCPQLEYRISESPVFASDVVIHAMALRIEITPGRDERRVYAKLGFAGDEPSFSGKRHCKQLGEMRSSIAVGSWKRS